MLDVAHTASASRSAFLDLQEELRLVNDGYEFLDEKRTLLAAEMLRQREAYTSLRKRLSAQFEQAFAELLDAAADLGIDGLQVFPKDDLSAARVRKNQRQYVGLTLLNATLEPGEARSSRSPLQISAAALTCGASFRRLLSDVADHAAIATNLMRLTAEYQRTERRVRALENVVLPEIHGDLETMEARLDILEQEEVIRVRIVRGGRTG